jgi:hypothetical protein
MATKIYQISTLHLTTIHTIKSSAEISQNLVAFSEYMNFIEEILPQKSMLVRATLLATGMWSYYFFQSYFQYSIFGILFCVPN